MSTTQISIAGQTITVVALPAAPGLKQIDWKYSDQVATVRSAFTGQVQRQKWMGADLLAGTAELPPLTAVQADDWECFLMQLRGRANAFQISDPLRPTTRGSGGSFGNAPLVDNTVSWGNAAGSEMVGTKGWIANQTGVLKRGDWVQIGFRLYRVLDDVTSDALGNATIPIWPTLREQPSSDGISHNYVNATATCNMVISGGFGVTDFGVIWGSFSTPALPSDAVIQGIYPVIVASATHDQAISTYYSGTGLRMSSWGAPFINLPTDPANTTFSSSEFYGASIGTSLSALIGQEVAVGLHSSLDINSMADVINVTAVGYAVYYTSATPLTDPQIPPPFTVPSGQGLAWSMPYQMAFQTGVVVGAIGVFQRGGGEGVGTPAIDNGTIIVDNPRGLFCLSQNDRASSVDYSRLAKTGFAFEEYR